VVETLLRDSDVVGIALGGQRLRYWYTGADGKCLIPSSIFLAKLP
jgi:hypothetical protein